MTRKFLQFSMQLAIFTLILGAMGILLRYLLPPGSTSSLWFPLLLLFLLVTLAVHFVLLKVTRLNPRRFVSYFMLTTFVKLLVYFAALLAYLLTKPGEVLAFILTFLVLYILYTAFEVVAILRQSRAEGMET